MKKRVLSMLMVVMMMCSLLSVNVLAHDNPEQCTVATTWSFDATDHWYACADDASCTQQHSKAAHADTTTVDGKCDDCGYVLHEHIWSAADWDHNDDYHWNVCKGAGTCYVTAEKDMYGYAQHDWKEDTTNTDPSKTVYNCICGATKSEHKHVWATTLSHDADNHWYACTATGCDGSVKDKTAHVWEVDSANSTETDTAYKCVCGETDSTHSHKWSSDWATDGTYHWHTCAGCTDISDKEIHLDANNSGRCDDCKIAMSGSKTLTNLDISGLTEPADGVKVDMTVTVSPADTFGAPEVAWNKVISLSANTSEKLGNAHTFAGDEMYNTCISIPVAKADKLADDFNVTLNGKKIEFYSSVTTAKKVLATYDGEKTVSVAYREVTGGGYAYIRVCVMYAELPDNHVHTYTSDWVESAAKHYLMCTGCGDTKDSGRHYDDNDSGLCDVCGFDMRYYNPNATATNTGSGSGGTHTHTYSTDYIESATQHWKQCLTCSTKKEIGNHVDANKTGKCDVCGFVMTSSCTNHTYSTDYKEDSVHHWKECTICGIKTAIETHADANKSGLCDVCGYTMVNPNTGDNGVIYVWGALFVVCIVGVAMTITYMRKKESE